MLYHFPEESPEDLLKIEAAYLEKQLENAKRVETHGYRRKEPSIPSLFIEWECIHKYLGCPIEKWSLPLTSKDKVELERLPSDFLPFMDLCKPLQYFDPDSNEYVRRVVGFREIQKKREHLEYLREIELEMSCFYDDEESNDDGDRVGSVRIEIDDEEEGDKENVEVDTIYNNVDSESEKHKMDALEEEAYYKSHPFRSRLSRGGGKKDKKDKTTDKSKDKKQGKEKDKENTTKKDKDKSHGKGKDKGKRGKKKNSNESTGIFDKIWDYFTETPSGKKGESKKHEKKKKDKEESSSKKGKGSKKSKRKSSGQGWNVSHIWQDLEKQKQLMQKENQENLEKIFKYHGMFRVKTARERDSEWLELSHTDPEDKKKEIKTFDKPYTSWMKEGISFESQYLARTLRSYWCLSFLFLRSFISVKPQKNQPHMDFTHKKKNVVPFFLTTIFLWCCFCLIIISFVDIQLENEKHASPPSSGGDGSKEAKYKKLESGTGNETLEHLQKRAKEARHNVEELQLNLYEIPLYVFLINLILVAVWSVLLILGDGKLIAHYFTCWCAALAEMETSGCLSLKKLIVMQHAEFFSYVIVIVVLFYYDYPAHVRQSNLLISGLIVRPLKPDLRIEAGNNLLYYQVAGLLFQLYVVYCTVLIKLLMKILATILKNASEMWNFKFALTFQQLTTKNRGQLLRLGLNHSLLKLFTHHRILTVLLRNFGEVFSIPIMIYMVCEMGVMTVALVRWFFYKADTAEEYGGRSDIIIQTLRTSLKTGLKVKEDDVVISYFHSRAEVHFVLYLLMWQCLIQFVSTTDLLAKSGNSFFAGYEFVRRSGTILCRNSHQRRLIQSLEWSFSSTNPSVLSANSYFAINRSTILASFAAVAGFFSLIIQLQVQPEHTTITFNTIEDCATFDQELLLGSCIPIPRQEGDPSLSFVQKDTTI